MFKSWEGQRTFKRIRVSDCISCFNNKFKSLNDLSSLLFNDIMLTGSDSTLIIYRDFLEMSLSGTF